MASHSYTTLPCPVSKVVEIETPFAGLAIISRLANIKHKLKKMDFLYVKIIHNFFKAERKMSLMNLEHWSTIIPTRMYEAEVVTIEQIKRYSSH